jgi:hypothetical protein
MATQSHLDAVMRTCRSWVLRSSLDSLPPGIEEKMFLPLTQSGTDKSDLGLGLAICQRCTEVNNGTLTGP